MTTQELEINCCLYEIFPLSMSPTNGIRPIRVLPKGVKLATTANIPNAATNIGSLRILFGEKKKYTDTNTAAPTHGPRDSGDINPAISTPAMM